MTDSPQDDLDQTVETTHTYTHTHTHTEVFLTCRASAACPSALWTVRAVWDWRSRSGSDPRPVWAPADAHKTPQHCSCRRHSSGKQEVTWWCQSEIYKQIKVSDALMFFGFYFLFWTAENFCLSSRNCFYSCFISQQHERVLVLCASR